MPVTPKGEKIKKAMEKQYGKEKGEQVFYASANKGTIKGVHEGEAEAKEFVGDAKLKQGMNKLVEELQKNKKTPAVDGGGNCGKIPKGVDGKLG
jgi:hypothetical protein